MRKLFLLPLMILGMVSAFYLPVLPHFYWQYGLGLALLLLLAFVYRPNRVCLGLLAILLGMLYSLWRLDMALAAQVPITQQDRSTWQIQVLEVSPSFEDEQGKTKLEARVWLDGANPQDDKPHYAKIVFYDYQARSWPIGSIWQVNSRLKAPISLSNPHGSNMEAWALNQGVQGTGNLGKQRVASSIHVRCVVCWINQKRLSIYQSWQQQDLPAAGLGLMAALTLGFQSALPAESWPAFRDLGIVHLVSISGLHVTMVAAVMTAWIRLILSWFSHRMLRPHIWAMLVGVLCASLYAGLAGFSVPTQRSLGMLWFAWFILYRRDSVGWWSAWCWALLAVLLWQPMAVLGLGTWLSFGFIAVIIMGNAYRIRKNRYSFWRQAMLAQWQASIASVIFLGWMVSALPILSVPVNLVAIPLFSMVLTPLSLFCVVWPISSLVSLTAYLNDISLSLLLGLHDYAVVWSVPKMPTWMWTVLCVMLTLLLLPFALGFRFLSMIWIVILVLYQAPTPPKNTVEINVLDIGQGLAVLIQTEKHQLLFDTGLVGSSGVLVNTLRAHGIGQLDMVILSHDHSDHTGGWPEVKRQFTVKKWLVDAHSAQSKTGALPCDADAWVWDGVYFELLTPVWSKDEKVKENDRSCVLRVVVNEQALLITGDLEAQGEKRLLANYGEYLFSQILVLGHHGSNTSTTPEFLRMVEPQWAIASSGYLNHYKHPSLDTISHLEEAGVSLWRTDSMGAVQIQIGQTLRVQSPLLYQKHWQRKPFAMPMKKLP